MVCKMDFKRHRYHKDSREDTDLNETWQAAWTALFGTNISPVSQQEMKNWVTLFFGSVQQH